MLDSRASNRRLAKWRAEAETMRRRGVLADGAALCEEILRDLQTVLRSEANALLTMSQAAMLGGYSAEHLRRLIRAGRLETLGAEARLESALATFRSGRARGPARVAAATMWRPTRATSSRPLSASGLAGSSASGFASPCCTR